MASLLNSNRPEVFCPDCSHERLVHALDKALVEMGYEGKDVVTVTNIGCSGLFDTFFNTHAFHGLHGRALTYATGIKMARPELEVIVTMGDGGLGIGGAHVLSTCRRNIDLTLLVLYNFNYGMTGGQCSSTTPQDAVVNSSFLNKLERPIDICQVAGSAGAPMVRRLSAYQNDLVERLKEAIAFKGFSLLDIWGICPGRFLRRNRLSPKDIAERLAQCPNLPDFMSLNTRKEYGEAYREEAAKQKMPPSPTSIEVTCKPPGRGRSEIIFLGGAGQRIITAGELLCLAGTSAGCHATQKNDYPITVMRGQSISEVILSDEEIQYTGIENPSVVIALAPEGVNRRKNMFTYLTPETLVIKSKGIELPASEASVIEIDFREKKIKSQDWALAALAILASENRVLNMEMLRAALKVRFKGSVYERALAVVEKVSGIKT